MKRIVNYIQGKLVDSMLQNENYIPIYAGDELLDFAYRKVEE